MTKLGRISEIHRYPVKSMQGEQLPSVEVDSDGIRGDRVWAVRDEGRGGIEGARKLPSLLNCRASFVESVPPTGECPVPEIEFTDGARLRADDPELARKLGLPYGEQPIQRDEIASLQEAFFSTSVRSIVPIVGLDGTTLGAGTPGPVTLRLMEAYASYCRSEARPAEPEA